MLQQILDVKYGYLYKEEYFQTRRKIIEKYPEKFNEASLYSYIDFSKVDPLVTYREAVKKFLNRISTKTNELYLAYSGGVDSEVILKVALEEGVKIKPVIVNLFDTNDIDVRFALNFCSKNHLEPLVININKETFLNELLPEIFYTVESGGYLLAAQVLATKYTPKNSTIIICGESPTQFYYNQGMLFSVLQEYSMWPLKANLQNNCNIVDPFWDAQVFMSFACYPQIKDRVLNCKNSIQWYADLDQLSKECYHSDKDFSSIERRFSLHGWESVKGTFGYNKGFFVGGTPDSRSYGLKSKPLVDPNLTSEYIYKILKNGICSNFDITNLQKSKYNNLNSRQWSPSDFNQFFYRPFCFDQFISSSITNLFSEKIVVLNENKQTYNM